MEKTFKEHMGSLEGFDKQALIIKIAKNCNVSLGTVANWIYGKYYPKHANREVISRIIGSPVTELFPKL